MKNLNNEKSEQIQVTEVKLLNPGMLLMPWPQDTYKLLRKKVVETFGDNWQGAKKEFKRGKSANKTLAGHIEGEFTMDIFEPFAATLSDITSNYCKYYGIKWSNTIERMNMWANFSKKHEFNPMHNHVGDLSWVSWINVPYDLDEEDALDNSKDANCKMNTRFHFMYSTLTGHMLTHTLAVDRLWEGRMIIFPAGLFHAVYPFYTSDDFRISLAGNIKFKPLEEKNKL